MRVTTDAKVRRRGSRWGRALVSALTGRVVRGDVAMTGAITLSGQVLRVGRIAEKLLAAHRDGLTGVILPRGNRREVDEDLGEALRRAVEVHPPGRCAHRTVPSGEGKLTPSPSSLQR